MEIAGAISAQIAHDPPSYLAGVEAAPPGFLNFTLADDWLRQQVNVIVADGPEFGSVPVGNRARVQVEFVSANPTGPVHIGTARNAALGDSIARILARAGWDVQREYYYNDAGAQMERFRASVEAIRRGEEPPAGTKFASYRERAAERMTDANFDVVEALGENALTNEIPIMILTAKQLTEADVAQLSGHVSTIIERGSIEDVDLLAKLVAALNKPVIPA